MRLTSCIVKGVPQPWATSATLLLGWISGADWSWMAAGGDAEQLQEGCSRWGFGVKNCIHNLEEKTDMSVSCLVSLILLMWTKLCMKSQADATRLQKTVFCPRRGSTSELQGPANPCAGIPWVNYEFLMHCRPCG